MTPTVVVLGKGCIGTAVTAAFINRGANVHRSLMPSPDILVYARGVDVDPGFSAGSRAQASDAWRVSITEQAHLVEVLSPRCVIGIGSIDGVRAPDDKLNFLYSAVKEAEKRMYQAFIEHGIRAHLIFFDRVNGGMNKTGVGLDPYEAADRIVFRAMDSFYSGFSMESHDPDRAWNYVGGRVP
jgi:hypothetical protein